MGVSAGIQEASEKMENKQWWLDVLREQLRVRGSLNVRPAAGLECYYGNPLGSLAVDWGKPTSEPETMCADTFRNWDFVKPWKLQVWDLLQPLACPSDPFEGVINRLWEYRKNGCHAVSFMALYEWLAGFESVWQCLLMSQTELLPEQKINRSDAAQCMQSLIVERSRFGRLHRLRWVRKPLLHGYVQVMQRAAAQLKLTEKALEESRQQAETVGNRFCVWSKVSPYAALVLMEVVRAEKGLPENLNRDGQYQTEARGADLLPGYVEALQTGQVVATPGGLRNIQRMVKPLTDAMVIDWYLYQNPQCIAELRKRLLPVEGDQKSMDMPNQTTFTDPLTRLVDETALPWAGGMPPLGQIGPSAQRLVQSSMAAPEKQVPMASNIKVTMEAGEPRIDLRIPWNEENLPNPDDLTAVVYVEARDGETVLTDAMFMDVYDVAWADQPGHLDVILEVTKFNCLLFEFPRAQKRKFLAGSFWPVGDLDWPRPVIGVRISMGRLEAAAG